MQKTGIKIKTDARALASLMKTQSDRLLDNFFSEAEPLPPR